MAANGSYTCNDYRQEMILLGLQRRLNRRDLTEAEKERLKKEIDRLEADMRMR